MARAKAADAPAEPAVARTLTDKLPVRLRTADLHALQSEDHYLRVHTSAGDALILVPMLARRAHVVHILRRARLCSLRLGEAGRTGPPTVVGGE